MDADGQHQPSELPRLIQPILDDEVDVVNGSRVLGAADPNHAARKLGIKVFAWALSLLTTSRVTDPACGYRAVRTEALRELEFHQDQFHNSEFILEASKRKLRSMEVPVTVTSRLSGASKKPPHFRYGLGFANALLRLAALTEDDGSDRPHAAGRHGLGLLGERRRLRVRGRCCLADARLRLPRGPRCPFRRGLGCASRLNPWYLLPAVGRFILTVIIRVVRWRSLFSARTRPAFAGDGSAAHRPASQQRAPFPGRRGRSIIALHSLAGSSRVETTGTVVLARLFDVLSLLLLLFVALPGSRR